jgi:hypothetical protein
MWRATRIVFSRIFIFIYSYFVSTTPTFIVKMPSQLCCACRQIPANFFSEEHDHKRFYHGPVVSLQPVNSMRRAASSGCPLCAFLIACVLLRGTGFLPLESDTVRLRRAMTDTHQGISLCIGIDDISHCTFFRVPPSWGKQEALLLLT